MYQINEIFYSIQGEGFFTGSPAIFVRFSGCNRKCSFCDTNHSITSVEMSVSHILTWVKGFPSKIVVFTGGEPLLQMDQKLIDAVHTLGKKVHIETNGTILAEKLSNIDFLTVSPKEGWVINAGSELKVVYQGQDLSEFDNTIFNHYYLQPCSMENIKETVEVCKKDPKWKLSLQTHKLISIR